MLDFIHLPDPVSYEEGLRLQQQHIDAILAGTGRDTILLLEHEPVYTIGRLRDQSSLRDAASLPFPVFETNRGGQATYHGPGQLVGYPITKLPSHVLVVDYVRRVEEAIIRGIADLGVTSGRVPGRSGVWLAANSTRPERKIAAIGIRVSRGVTMHGFSLNANVDLSWYDRFIPCGISDAGVTTLSAELGRDLPVAEAADAVAPHLVELLRWHAYEPSPDVTAMPGVSIPVIGLGAAAGVS